MLYLFLFCYYQIEYKKIEKKKDKAMNLFSFIKNVCTLYLVLNSAFDVPLCAGPRPMQAHQRFLAAKRKRLEEQKARKAEQAQKEIEQAQKEVEQAQKAAAVMPTPSQQLQTPQIPPSQTQVQPQVQNQSQEPVIPEEQDEDELQNIQQPSKKVQRMIAPQRAPMSMWRGAYLALAPTILGVTYQLFKIGIETVSAVLIKGFIKRRKLGIELEEKKPLFEAKKEEAIDYIQSNLGLIKTMESNPEKVSEEDKKRILKAITLATQSFPSLPPASSMMQQAFYAGMLSAVGGVVASLLVSGAATFLQNLMPQPEP